MAVTIRGTTPLTIGQATDPTSLTLTGTRQPNTNDVLAIVHCNDFYNLADMPTPTVGGSTTGVTSITTADQGANEGHIKAWYFVVTATGDLTVAVDEAGPADEEKGLCVYVLVGVDTASPIDGAAGAFGAASSSHVAPSISPASTNAFMICHVNTGGGAPGGAYTPPGSMTETYDFIVGGAMSVGGATEQLAASGATGTRTFTAGTAAGWVALSMAFKTAGGAAASASTPAIVVPKLAALQRAVW